MALTLMDVLRAGQDRYLVYDELRRDGPVYWDEWLRTWAVLGHREIVALSKDERVSGARLTDFYEQLPDRTRAAMAPLADVMADMMLFNEPPRHTRLRRLMRPGLTPRFVRGVRPLIEARADELLDRVASRGEFDVIGDFSEPLTRGMIADLTSLSGNCSHLLEAWPSLLHEFFTQSSEQVARIAALREGFDVHRDGLFHQLVADQLHDFTEDEIFANFLLLIDAGQATTTHLIGNAVLALLRHPGQLELLRSDPGLVPGAVDELIRYDSSVQYTTRIAVDDITIAGRDIKRGQSIALVLGAGNRDPSHYADPHRLDVTRRAHDHLAYGRGIHYCLGAPLANAEMQIALTKLLTRAGDLRLGVDEPEWLESINFRFMKHLPVRFSTGVGADRAS